MSLICSKWLAIPLQEKASIPMITYKELHKLSLSCYFSGSTTCPTPPPPFHSSQTELLLLFKHTKSVPVSQLSSQPKKMFSQVILRSCPSARPGTCSNGVSSERLSMNSLCHNLAPSLPTVLSRCISFHGACHHLTSWYVVYSFMLCFP